MLGLRPWPRLLKKKGIWVISVPKLSILNTPLAIGPGQFAVPDAIDERVRHAAYLEGSPHWDWHSHAEAQWIAAGDSIVVLETEEAAWLALPGQALLVASAARHHVSLVGARKVPSLYLAPSAFPPSPDASCRLLAVTPLMAAAVAALIADVPPIARVPSARARVLCDLIIDELSRPDLAPMRLPIPEDRGLRRLCGRLRERPGDPRDVDACAALAGMSRRTFTRRFRQETGETFVEWRRRARVMEALKLQARGETAKRIATVTGYPNVQALYAEARHVLGASLKSYSPSGARA